MARKALVCVAASGRDVVGVPRWAGLQGLTRVLALLPAALIGAVLLHATANAAEFPNRPIQLIVPYAPGGVTDQVARILAQGLEKRLGQAILVVNRPGASTILGTQSVARAAPDGYTIGLVSVTHVSNVSLYKQLPYTQSDFTPITPVANTVNVLVVGSELPVRSLSDLIAYIKARPGQMNYATFGIGSSAHLAGLLFETMIGAKMTAVHYRGGGPAAVGVMTGEVQMVFGGPLSVAGGVEAGKLRPIAVTSRQRLSVYPDVPTFLESGLDFVRGTWFGLLAPAGTPDPIVRIIADAVKYTMEETETRKAIVDSGTEVFVTSPEVFGRFIADETKLWTRVLAGIAIEKQ
jgi:tripartite-type tricarboxylate transporter receptor subunit TctC